MKNLPAHFCRSTQYSPEVEQRFWLCTLSVQDIHFSQGQQMFETESDYQTETSKH